MERLCIYLRKSRADEELEKALGEGETLSRHRKTLLEFAERRNFNVVQIHEELVSGESILGRPVMLKLLQEVDQGMYDGVLVMDIQRLGRGGLKDQGTILDAFKQSHTKIITPDKTYDLSDEHDEEWTEFEAFMSRKEYKLINKRLRRGILRSVKDGNYLSALPPFGYAIKEDKHARTLEPHPEQERFVKMIFEWYVNHCMGCQLIAHRLNAMGVRTMRNNRWTHNAVAYIIKNPIYIGMITWGKISPAPSTSQTKAKKYAVREKSEWIISKGLHKPIIDTEIFEKAQVIMRNNYSPPLKASFTLSNPLSGIMFCRVCGAPMQFRPYSNSEAHLICTSKCGNKSSKFRYVEESLINALRNYLQCYEDSRKPSSEADANIHMLKETINAVEKEFKNLKEQKSSIHDSYEKGVYDLETFQERCGAVSEKIAHIVPLLDKTKEQLKEEVEKQASVVTPLSNGNILDGYFEIKDNKKRNLLLKELLIRAEYIKEKSQREKNFKLFLYPKI